MVVCQSICRPKYMMCLGVAQALLDQPHNTRQMNECREMGDRGRKDLAAESEIREV